MKTPQMPPAGIAGALQPLVRGAGEPVVAVSHATGSHLVEALGPCAVVFAPVVRGRAVWAAVDAEMAVGQVPNSLGVLDLAPPERFPHTVAVVVAGGAPIGSGWTDVLRRSEESWTRRIEPTPRERDRFSILTGAAGLLAPVVRQVRGVFVPHGRPESPWFTVQVPLAVPAVCGVLNRRFPGAVRAVPLPAEAAGPGGLAVEVLETEMTAQLAGDIASVFADS